MPPKLNYPKGRMGFPYFQGGKPLQMPTERRKRLTTLCFLTSSLRTPKVIVK